MSPSPNNATGETRAVSPVVGVALMLVIVVVLVAVSLFGVLSLAESEVESTGAQSLGNYEFTIESGGQDTLVIRPEAVSKYGEDPTFFVRINGNRVHEWNGQDEVEIRCLYPGDKVTITTASSSTSSTLQTHYFDRTTDCSRFNSFPEKFSYAVVDGDAERVNDRYAFGLSLVPNGDSVATDSNGDNDLNLGKISLSNEWHYVRQYDRDVEGLEPPVFVVVLVDNVHWTDVPDPSAHPEVSAGTQYNWTDDPPGGLAIGSDAYSVAADGTLTTTPAGSEPTNDVYMVFKPGCEESTLKFIENNAGYSNEVYLEGARIIDDASDPSIEGQTFTAPGVECRGDTSWSD
jgi:flagellin-like protein